jgi:hypothetical protein
VTTPLEVGEAGHARYTYRLRVSSTALTALLGEWDRCRWIWNECCARSKKAHRDEEKCGPARLDKMLTEARTHNAWLREGSSVPQQQIIRDFGKTRAKALKDIKARLPMRQRAGMPKYKKKSLADPSLNYNRNGFRLKDGRLHLAGGIGVTVVCRETFLPTRRPRVSTATASATGTPRSRGNRSPAAAGDRQRAGYRLGGEGDRDNHQRHPRPSSRRARAEGRRETHRVSADDGPA